MINKNLSSSTLFSITVALVLLNLVGCKPSLEKESNAVRRTISILDTTSHDDILAIKNQIKEAYPALETYQKKVVEILSAENSNNLFEDIFSKHKELTSLYIDKVERYDKHLAGTQRNVFRKSMLGGVKRSFEFVLELDTITTSEFSNLTNEQKIKLIADTETKIAKEFEGMSAVDEYFKKLLYNTTEGILGATKFLD